MQYQGARSMQNYFYNNCRDKCRVRCRDDFNSIKVWKLGRDEFRHDYFPTYWTIFINLKSCTINVG